MLPGRDIEASQSLAKEIGKITKCQAAYDRKRDALDRDAVHSLALSGSVVLPHKGDGRLIKGVHGGVDKALNAGGGRGAGGQHRVVKGVDGRLDDHVRQGEPAGRPTWRIRRMTDH